MTKELKILRIKHEISQEEVAKKLGVKKSAYCRKENGKVAFSLNDVKIIKEIFNLTPEKICEIFFT